MRAMKPALPIPGLIRAVGLSLALALTVPDAFPQGASSPASPPFTLPFKGNISVPLGSGTLEMPGSGRTGALSQRGPKRLAASDAASPSVSQTVDALAGADIRQALDLLRKNYVASSTLTEEALDRATLQGLLERLGAGAIVRGPAPSAIAPSPFRAEVLNNWIGYTRLGSLNQENLAAFDAALAGFAGKGLVALIVDLRATPATGDFEQAAEFIKRLTPKGRLLFSVHRPNTNQDRLFTSNQDPAFQGIVVTLVNHETAGPAEAIAGVLRVLNNGLVVGQKTAGQAAEFSEFPLSGGKVLRVAVAEVKLPENLTIFPDGLKPDLPVNLAPGEDAEALRVGLEKGVSGLVFETERVRLNEAALVAGVNPELDEIETSRKNGTKPGKIVTDPVLQRAVDLVTTVQIFGAKPRQSAGQQEKVGLGIPGMNHGY